jgi:hypothetical protein
MSAYEITVSFTPLCPSCGKECEASITESRPSSHPFDRDNPYERCSRRVFVTPCADCWEFKPKAAPLSEAQQAREVNLRG